MSNNSSLIANTRSSPTHGARELAKLSGKVIAGSIGKLKSK
ncbi:hypothetical protein [[Eubacterium] cellulosolvens]